MQDDNGDSKRPTTQNKITSFFEEITTDQQFPPPAIPTFRTPTSEMPPLEAVGAHLIVLVGVDVGRTFAIENEVLIGRSPDAIIRSDTTDLSRRHAVVRRTDDNYFVEDLGSRNGTLVNGTSVKVQPLRFGDKIRVGSELLLLFAKYDAIEDRLLQAQRLESIGQLASGVAHDFNNILGAALANTGYLRGLPDSAQLGLSDIRETIEDIDASLRRAADLARQLLVLTRADQRCDRILGLEGLLEEVAKLVQRTFDEAISFQIDLEPVSIVGDAGQLHQLVMNLCLNARDAMPQGGTLLLRCREVQIDAASRNGNPNLPNGQYAVIAVQDSGTGIPAKIREKIFDPFFTTKASGSGSGLGLSTAYQIVKSHGGHFEFESDARGTTFSVYLPTHGATGDFSRGSTKVDLPASTKRMWSGVILLVDDEDRFRRGAQRLLEGMGYPCKGASDGIEALEVFSSAPDIFKLVILDLNMPRMNGVETFHALKRIAPKVRIMISSGQTESPSIRALLDAGALCFLQKPYGVRELGEALSKAFNE